MLNRSFLLSFTILVFVLLGCQKSVVVPEATCSNVAYVATADSPTTPICYQNIQGQAVVQGDILLGNVDEVQSKRAAVENGQAREGIALNKASSRWKDGIVPFEILPEISQTHRSQILAAVAHINSKMSGRIQWVAKTNQTDYVYFEYWNNPLACASAVGHIGGRQPIYVAYPNGCGTAPLIHEMGHALGLQHEQGRKDRNQYVTINLTQAMPQYASEFQIYPLYNNDSLGPYNYTSIMHYPSNAFGKTASSRTIVRKDGQTALGNGVGLNDGDVATLDYLYGASAYPTEMLAQAGSEYQSLSLSFQDNSTNETGFRLQLNNTTLDLPAQAGKGRYQYQLPNLGSAVYTVSVAAILPGGTVSFSSNTASSLPSQTLPEVSGLSVETAPGSVRLSWSFPLALPVTYRIVRSIIGVASQVVQTAETTQPTYVDTTVQTGVAYRYTVSVKHAITTTRGTSVQAVGPQPANVTPPDFEDDFNRADANSLGSQWANSSALIVRNQMIQVSGPSSSGWVTPNQSRFWNATNVRIEGDYDLRSSLGQGTKLQLIAQAQSSYPGYYATYPVAGVFCVANGACEAYLGTNYGTRFPGTTVAVPRQGRIGFEANGSQLKLFLNGGVVATATYGSGSGYAKIEISNFDVRMDNIRFYLLP